MLELESQYKTEDFIKLGEALTDDVIKMQEKDEDKKLLTTIKERSQIIRTAKNDTDVMPDYVVLEGIQNNVVAQIATATNVISVNFNHADDVGKIKHALWHEQEHEDNQFFDVDLGRAVSQDQLSALNKELGFDISQVDLVEGFTEYKNITKHSLDNNSGYAAVEVPAAEKLEKLCKENLGLSLAELFNAATKESFYARIGQLSEALLRQQCLDKFMMDKLDESTVTSAAISKNDLRDEVLKSSKENKVKFSTAEDGLKSIEKLAGEILSIRILRNSLMQGGSANQNSQAFALAA